MIAHFCPSAKTILNKQTRKGLMCLTTAAMLSVSGIGSALADDKKFNLKTPTAFKTDLPVTGTSAVHFGDTIKAVSGGTIKFKYFEPGELIPAFEIHKAVSDGQVQAGYTCSAYLGGSLKEAIPFCTFPFSPHPEVIMAWLYEGNGMKLFQKMYDDAGYNLKAFPPCDLLFRRCWLVYQEN